MEGQPGDGRLIFDLEAFCEGQSTQTGRKEGMSEGRPCRRCGQTMLNVHGRRQYCSTKCAHGKSNTAPRVYLSRQLGLSTGQLGAVGELVASVDLIRRGYEVFRAVSPACSCDLIILKNGMLRRVEVRTAYRNVNGTITYPRQTKDEGRSDVFALIVDGGVIYEPTLD